MKCAECESEKFFELTTGCTMLGWGMEGPHQHDPNNYTTYYRCGNGHGFTISYEKKCPVWNCEWPMVKDPDPPTWELEGGVWRK